MAQLNVMESRSKHSIYNIAGGALNRISGIVVPFIMRTLIIKVLGEEYLGVNSLFSSILEVLNFAELGLGSAIAANMYKPIAEKDTMTICALLNFYRKWYRVIGFTIIGLGASILPFLRHFISGEVPDGVNIYILFVLYISSTSFSYLFWAYKSTLISAHQRMSVVEIIGALCKIIAFLFQLIAILFFRDILLYAAANLLCIVLNNIMAKYISDRDYPNYICKGNLSNEIKGRIKMNVLALIFQKIGLTVSNSIGTIIISSFLGLGMVAIYGNYFYILAAVGSFIVLIYGGITASVGNSMIVESVDKNYEDFIQFSVFNCWLVGWFSICLLCLYQPFVNLWMGDRLMLDNIDVVFFVLCFFFQYVRRVVMTYKDAAGMWYADKFKPIVSCIFTILLSILLIDFYGIKGILIAHIVSNSLIEMPWETYVLFKIYFKKSQKHYYYMLSKVIFSYIIIGAIMFFICNFIANNIMGICLRVFLCAILPNVFVYLIYVKSQEMLEYRALLDKLVILIRRK